jgi:hypothetical protein
MTLVIKVDDYDVVVVDNDDDDYDGYDADGDVGS